MSLTFDYVYFKDIKNFGLQPGVRQEIRHKAPLKGKVVVRVMSSNPVTIDMAGPHVEHVEVHGSRELSFTAEPGTEFYVGIQNQKGFFAKSANVTFEVEMYGSKRAYEMINRLKNLHSMLRDSPELYELEKDAVKEVLKETIDIYGVIDEPTKQMIKELIALTKKLETPPTA